MRARAAVVLAALVAAASVIVAIVIHRPINACSYLGGQPPPPCPQHDYSLGLRLGIVAGGLLVAGLIIAASRFTGNTRVESRPGSRASGH
jgi:hypothetical protein